MKKSLSDLYQDIILNESEKNSLQNPKNNEVGDLPSENMFGSTPDPVKGTGPEKAKLQKGPSYNKIDTGAALSSKESNKTLPKSAPAKSPKVDAGVEMEDDDVTPDEENEVEEYKKSKKNNQTHEESFTMSAFEKLFKQTLSEEIDDEPMEMEDDIDLTDEEEAPEEESEESEESEEQEHEEEEEDLISDLRNLQTQLNSILDRLQSLESEEEEEEEGGYTEDDFDEEFGDEEEEGEEGEETPVKESKQSNLKPVNKSKIKTLQHKNNKVGKVSPKGGKAKGNSLKVTPNPKALGDKKKVLQSHNNKVKSSVDKGEFFK